MDEQYKIAFLDIETAPNLAYVWGKWEQDVIAFEKQWYILSFSVKYADSKKAQVYALPDFTESYSEDPTDDRALVGKLWEILDGSDLVIAHNGDKFDLKKINARLIVHGFPPPSPYKTIDTLKVAKKYFAFDSNRLNDLCQLLGLGKKFKTGGFELWMGCLRNDPESWAKMKKYNTQDVYLLELLYNRFRGWITTHPNINLNKNCEKLMCPACGSDKIQRRGFYNAKTYRSQKFVCLQPSCRKWSFGKREKIPGVVLA